MYKKIYKEIKKFDTIVIARHIGVDPDALASQLALRDSIRLSFPDKKVYAIGTGSAKFGYIGKLDKFDGPFKDALLIVTDTPDRKRVDTADPSLFSSTIKIDHHPFIEKYCDIELIDQTKLECNRSIAEMLYIGLVSDSNRFLFNSCTASTFCLVSKYLDLYKFNINELYQKMYVRPIDEVRLEVIFL